MLVLRPDLGPPAPVVKAPHSPPTLHRVGKEQKSTR